MPSSCNAIDRGSADLTDRGRIVTFCGAVPVFGSSRGSAATVLLFHQLLPPADVFHDFQVWLANRRLIQRDIHLLHPFGIRPHSGGNSKRRRLQSTSTSCKSNHFQPMMRSCGVSMTISHSLEIVRFWIVRWAFTPNSIVCEIEPSKPPTGWCSNLKNSSYLSRFTSCRRKSSLTKR